MTHRISQKEFEQDFPPSPWDKKFVAGKWPGLLPTMLRDELLVRLAKPERLNIRIWIPDSAKREDYELYQGTVLASGPGRRRKNGQLNANEVQVGDKILFHWSALKADIANVQWREDGAELRVVSEWQVQACWPGHLTLEEAMRC